MKGVLVSWRTCLESFALYPLMAAVAVFFGGILFWGGLNWSLEITNTQTFCVSCHEMREYVFKEYKKTGHYTNHIGIRASCPDCHVPREWGHKVTRKVWATNELFHWMRGSIDTAEKFEARRGELARRVWTIRRRPHALAPCACWPKNGTKPVSTATRASHTPGDVPVDVEKLR